MSTKPFPKPDPVSAAHVNAYETQRDHLAQIASYRHQEQTLNPYVKKCVPETSQETGDIPVIRVHWIHRAALMLQKTLRTRMHGFALDVNERLVILKDLIAVARGP